VRYEFPSVRSGVELLAKGLGKVMSSVAAQFNVFEANFEVSVKLLSFSHSIESILRE